MNPPSITNSSSNWNIVGVTWQWQSITAYESNKLVFVDIRTNLQIVCGKFGWVWFISLHINQVSWTKLSLSLRQFWSSSEQWAERKLMPITCLTRCSWLKSSSSVYPFCNMNKVFLKRNGLACLAMDAWRMRSINMNLTWVNVWNLLVKSQDVAVFTTQNYWFDKHAGAFHCFSISEFCLQDSVENNRLS